MELSPSKASKSLPVAAALSLACATFSENSRAFADERALAPITHAADAEKRFDRSDLQRMESFAHFLAIHESLLPPAPQRARVFHALASDGVFSQLKLHPLERTALESLATTDASTLRFKILTTRAHTKNSFSMRNMFGATETAPSSTPTHASNDLTKEEATLYARALVFCHLISGHLSTTSTNGSKTPTEMYLNAQSVEHHIKLLQVIGALEVTKGVDPATLAAQIGRTYLTKASATISEIDRANIPELNSLSSYTSNVIAYRLFVLASAASTFAMYACARKRITSQ